MTITIPPVHKSITYARICRMSDRNERSAVDDGVCLHCGRTVHAVEADADHITCTHCHQPSVCGTWAAADILSF